MAGESLQTLYLSSSPIKKKLNDLLELLHFIPSVYHSFYQNLKHSTATSHGDDDEEEDKEDYQEDNYEDDCD